MSRCFNVCPKAGHHYSLVEDTTHSPASKDDVLLHLLCFSVPVFLEPESKPVVVPELPPQREQEADPLTLLVLHRYHRINALFLSVFLSDRRKATSRGRTWSLWVERGCPRPRRSPAPPDRRRQRRRGLTPSLRVSLNPPRPQQLITLITLFISIQTFQNKIT